MPEIYTLAEAQAFYDEAKAAYNKALHAEGYDTAGGNSLQRAKVESLQKQMDKWKRIINRHSGTNSDGISVTGVTPI